ncbi:MAG: cytochrome c3 family protein [Candidatus Zixiibacteriota bacterium]
MKRLLFALVATLFLAVPALIAGDYHTGTTLECSECHVMHGSQAHGYNVSGEGTFTSIGASAPYEYLLRDEVNNLCLSCHDGQSSAPDVLEAKAGLGVRQAGALNRDGASPYYHADGHTLDATDVAPGGTWKADSASGLHCGHCHDPHGDPGSGSPDTTGLGQYRNLRADPGGTSSKWMLYAVGTNDVNVPVFERSATGGSHYRHTNVDFNEPLTDGSYYGAWCQGCHTNFHGSSGSANMGGSGGTAWLRHPSADADIGAVGGIHSSASLFAGYTNKVKVMTATEDWDPDSTAAVTDHTPSCFSCHKAHGNQNSFGLIFMKGTGTVDEEGDDGTEVRDLCKQCHVQGQG